MAKTIEDYKEWLELRLQSAKEAEAKGGRESIFAEVERETLENVLANFPPEPKWRSEPKPEPLPDMTLRTDDLVQCPYCPRKVLAKRMRVHLRRHQ